MTGPEIPSTKSSQVSTLERDGKSPGSPGRVYFRSTPHPLTVTTRIITFLVGNPYKPSFATVTGWGVDPRCTIYLWYFQGELSRDTTGCTGVHVRVRIPWYLYIVFNLESSWG